MSDSRVGTKHTETTAQDDDVAAQVPSDMNLSPTVQAHEIRPAVDLNVVNLEQLQPTPDEVVNSPKLSSGGSQAADNVNALALSMDRSASYLGISSVTAVLRLIVWLDPGAQAYFLKTANRNTGLRPQTPVESEAVHKVRSEISHPPCSPWDEIPLIKAFFSYVHPFAPFLDEMEFRQTYMSHSRSDSRWLLLLNSVLALGSMVSATDSQDDLHRVYWARAKRHLTIETMASVHVETVQALALLAGLYLHYIQQPDQAGVLMGATLRLATALGLHRDYSEGLGVARPQSSVQPIEFRRRVWWAVFVLDAWVGYSLGRPSMGRTSPAITAQLPGSDGGQLSQLDEILEENARFCQISTRLEDTLACTPLITEQERRRLEGDLMSWFQSSSVQEPECREGGRSRLYTNEEHGIRVLRNVMRWRYLQCRIIIHRPILLWCALHSLSFETLPDDQKASITTCFDVTSQLIHDISTTWQMDRPCQMGGWNATWLLHQALMVPLLLLFAAPLGLSLQTKSHALIETGMAALKTLRHWSPTAEKTFDVVSRIYNASRRREHPQHETVHQDHSTAAEEADAFPGEVFSSREDLARPTVDFYWPTEDLTMDGMFDSLNWSSHLWHDTFSFETPSLPTLSGENIWNPTAFQGALREIPEHSPPFNLASQSTASP